MSDYRIERDSMGELKVPAKALYAAQTQRAVQNFPISGLTMPREFIRAVGLIKSAAAEVNAELGHLDAGLAKAIRDVFPLTPRGIIDTLDLLRPIYRKTAAYGHFGRPGPEFTWERTDRAAALRDAVTSKAVAK